MIIDQKRLEWMKLDQMILDHKIVHQSYVSAHKSL